MIIRIKKDKHRCNKIIPIIKLNTVEGYVLFDGDFEYNILKQEDTNKLVGLSDSYFHHINSIRIGWRWSVKENKIEIMSILYRKSKRYIEHFCFIDEEDLYFKFKIVVTKNTYELSFGDCDKTIIRQNNWFLPRYVLFPYFGGSTTAPKDFIFNMEF
jgi:hypothetical protein